MEAPDDVHHASHPTGHLRQHTAFHQPSGEQFVFVSENGRDAKAQSV